MNRISIWTLATAAVFLAACGESNRMAGGGSSESGNAIVAGRVTDTGGATLNGAKVFLIDNENWLSKTLAGTSVVLDSARTDGNGRFRLRFELDRKVNLQVEGAGQGLLVREFQSVLDTGENALSLTAAPYGEIRGTVDPDSGKATGVSLPGTSYRALITEANAFSLARVPEENYPTLVFLQSGSRSAEIPGPAIPVRSDVVASKSIAIALDRMLLEDFSQPWPRSLLTLFTGNGGWHEVRDIGPPAFHKSTLSRRLEDGLESYSGTSMKMICVLDSLYSGIGFHLGKGADGFDWSKLKSLSFQAKGKGKIRVSVESLLLDSVGQDQFEYLIAIPAEWTRIEIPVDSLRLRKGSVAEQRGITWSQSSRSVTRVEFVVKSDFTAPKDTTLLWMDDLTAQGVGLRTFLP